MRYATCPAAWFQLRVPFAALVLVLAFCSRPHGAAAEARLAVITAAAGDQADSQLVEITPDLNGTTVHMSVGDRLLVELGADVNWTVALDPDDGTLFTLNTVFDALDKQGLYLAAAPGTVTLNATGMARCVPGLACARFAAGFSATIVIDAPTADGDAAVPPATE